MVSRLLLPVGLHGQLSSASNLTEQGWHLHDLAMQLDASALVHRLPVEVLCLVFEFSVPFRFIHSQYFVTRISRKEAPWSLLQVCSHWRQVALLTPALWNTFALWVCPPGALTLGRTRSWLEVAPKLPLSLMIGGLPRRRDTDPLDTACQLLEIFSKESYRWKSLTISLYHDLAKHFLNLLRSTPLSIQELDICFGFELAYDCPEVNDEIMHSLHTLKELRKLRWTGAHNRVGPDHLPWNKLRDIKVEALISSARTISYLARCTSARSVTFTASAHDTDNPNDVPLPQAISTLPDLLSLTLDAPYDPMQVINYFSFPSLHTLRLQSKYHDLAALARVISECSQLRRLLIDNRFIPTPLNNISQTTTSVISYLTNYHVARIQNVQIIFKGAYTCGQMIVRMHPTIGFQHSGLTCWYDGRSCTSLGWGTVEDLIHDVTSRPIWKYRQGVLDFTPDYQRIVTQFDARSRESGTFYY